MVVGPLAAMVFANEQVLDEAGLAARISSISFIACLPEVERVRVLVRARVHGRRPCDAALPHRGPRLHATPVRLARVVGT